MKSLALALALTCSSAYAKNFYEVTINWNAKHLGDSTVLMCDDTHFDGVIIDIPGDLTLAKKIGPEYYMKYQNCGLEWKITKKELIQKNGQTYTRVRLTGNSECTIEIQDKDFRSDKTFIMEIYDAC